MNNDAKIVMKTCGNGENAKTEVYKQTRLCLFLQDLLIT